MVSSSFIFFLYPIFIHTFSPTLAQPDFVLYHCSDSGNYTSNSAYRANLLAPKQMTSFTICPKAYTLTE